MIGVFDSGVGGMASYEELRALLPRADMVYLADRENAPYGTKQKDEIIRLVKRDLSRLQAFGCKRILMACCTASSVYPSLDEREKEICLPIISPAARIAARYERVTVIATEHTVSSGAFQKEILSHSSACAISAIPLPELVSLVEGGLKDGCVSESGAKHLDKIAEKILALKTDALVLGCTHFSRVEKEFKKRLAGVSVISPAREGAIAMARLIGGKGCGRGRNVYL